LTLTVSYLPELEHFSSSGEITNFDSGKILQLWRIAEFCFYYLDRINVQQSDIIT
jgi:hypothetical protein